MGLLDKWTNKTRFIFINEPLLQIPATSRFKHMYNFLTDTVSALVRIIRKINAAYALYAQNARVVYSSVKWQRAQSPYN